MENASKALIIAGAILLAILLISLGIMIFNQAQGVVDGSGMSEAEIGAFNSKLTKYEGKQKGSVVKTMMNEVLSINTADGSIDDEVQVSVKLYKADGTTEEAELVTKNVDGKASTISNSDKINSSTTFTVKMEYVGARINEIKVIGKTK